MLLLRKQIFSFTNSQFLIVSWMKIFKINRASHIQICFEKNMWLRNTYKNFTNIGNGVLEIEFWSAMVQWYLQLRRKFF